MLGLLILLIVVAALVAVAVVYRETLIRWYDKAAAFLKEVRVEMQKVVWPSRQEVYGATFVVMVSTFALTVAIGIEDFLLSQILDLILRLTT